MHYLTFVRLKLHLPFACPNLQPVCILLHPLKILFIIWNSRNVVSSANLIIRPATFSSKLFTTNNNVPEMTRVEHNSAQPSIQESSPRLLPSVFYALASCLTTWPALIRPHVSSPFTPVYQELPCQMLDRNQFKQHPLPFAHPSLRHLLEKLDSVSEAWLPLRKTMLSVTNTSTYFQMWVNPVPKNLSQ